MKRLKNYNFYSFVENMRCEGKDRLCGGSKDGSKVCIPETEECPINYISFSEKDDGTFDTISIPDTD